MSQDTQVPGEALGISPLPASGAPTKSDFTFWDFVGIFFFQQFATAFVFSIISAFVVPPMAPSILQHLWGENGAVGLLSMPRSAVHQIMLLASTLVGNMLVIVAYIYRGRVVYRASWRDLGWRSSEAKHIIRWVILFYPLVFGFTIGYNAILKLLAFAPPKQQIASFLSADQPLTLRVFAITLVLVGAPLTEELLYRGVLFRSLTKLFSVQGAAILSGLLFGAAHMEVMTILPLAFLGYLLAMAYHQSRSLWLPIGLHACNNLMALLFLYLVQTH
jgi:membrane protease YdiL (CAAX protease family)